jgi:protein-S-isoprenylcysteine O-methyltransferase Ste14
MVPYVVLTLAWVAYFVLHSLLAANGVKQIAYRWWSPRTYRLLYSVFATVGLFALLFLNGSIAAPYFVASEGPIRFASLVLTTFGVIVVQVSFRAYSLRAFIGLAEEPTTGLKTDGIQKYIRHPLYAGTILITCGFFLFIPNLPTLISCGCVLLYLPIGIWLEERKLIEQFGEAYRTYQKTVPALVPWPW